jgi:hypothetical protein
MKLKSEKAELATRRAGGFAAARALEANIK